MNQHNCPVCEGRKETQAFVCGVGTGGLRVLPCKTCNAKGWLSDDEMVALGQRKAKHVARRDARLKMDLSMREMAKRMGVSLVDYSSYEHGRIDF